MITEFPCIRQSIRGILHSQNMKYGMYMYADDISPST